MNHYFNIMILTLILVAISGIGCSDDNGTTDPDGHEYEIPGWDLVWQDEFDGNQIDLTKWEHEVNAAGGGNNELQYYTARPENSFLENGKLVIKAIKETYTSTEGTREYTSARLRTPNKGDWLYGRFDIKAKLPKGQGLWPAIWMLPTDWEYGGWPLSGEIDIMELLGHEPHIVYGTIHFGNSFPNNVHIGTSYQLPSGTGTFYDDFHLFTLIWEKGKMDWFVDGNHYQTLTENQWFTATDQTNNEAPFDKRFHMILNVAVGGNWPGNPDATTIFPQTMEVEYVRVYKKAE